MKKHLLPLFVSAFFIGLTSGNLSANDFSNCTEKGCHNALIKHSVVHSPAEDDCMSCHETSAKTHPVKDKTEFKLLAAVPELCSECHDPMDEKEHVHPPVEEGKCLDCHNPHSTENEYMLKEDVGKTCAECHDLSREGQAIHGPVAAGMCTACHDPHQSDLAGLVKREDREMCIFCHTNKKDPQGMVSVHEPFTETCLDCHSPHSSPYKFMVEEDVPGLCFNCHEEVQVQVGKQSEVHGPFQKGEKCYLCHNAHVSKYTHLLQDQEQSLCFTCHNKKIKKGDRVVKNIAKRVLHSKYVHSPIEDEGCAACHLAHTPDNFFLLTAKFPSGAYGEGKVESFEHCFDCHDSELMTEKETTEDTEFRDGSRNLHYVHVHREKARNCTTCHDVHGTNYEHLIAQKVPFGNWEMPMKYKVTPDGGSCLTGCHKLLSYSRAKGE
jgi:predicted CXXCH cytochrome family protein